MRKFLVCEGFGMVAAKWHTTYHIVNLLIFIVFYLILLGLNICLAYYLCSY